MSYLWFCTSVFEQFAPKPLKQQDPGQKLTIILVPFNILTKLVELILTQTKY